MDSSKKYQRRKVVYKKLHEKQTKTSDMISNLRLLVVIAGIAAALAMYILKQYILLTADILIIPVLFVLLAVRHQKVIEAKLLSSILYEINDESQKRTQGNWKEFADVGEEFVEDGHPYAGDLDIFGRGSLFQFINTAVTYLGRQKFKIFLTEKLNQPKEIGRLQKAVTELSAMLKWRQRFQANGRLIAEKIKDPGLLVEWAANKDHVYTKPMIIAGARVLPIITVILIALAFLTDVIDFWPVAGMLFIQLIMLRFKFKERENAFKTAIMYRNSLKTYDHMLRLLENHPFSSEYINGLKAGMQNTEKLTAFQQVNKLTRIIDSISNRYNAFYFVFNLVTLWDYQCMISLERWKERSGKYLKNWLDTIGEMEALSSLAILSHDNPDWVMPEIKEEGLLLKSNRMGHPLISKDRVYNDLIMEKPSSILLITGSNMSGKSTLLRTAGINLVLAYAGAPVCASQFTCSIMDIHTCMRVSDNLEMSISSFYAELLRIKMIIKASESGRPLFFLLDEIFKGTNSRDRHTGARMLIKKLSGQKALGMVSTHDLELADLEEESSGKVRNFHFREYYKNNEIYFDYKLKKGVSDTRNAIYLMRMAGIDIEDEK